LEPPSRDPLRDSAALLTQECNLHTPEFKLMYYRVLCRIELSFPCVQYRCRYSSGRFEL